MGNTELTPARVNESLPTLRMLMGGDEAAGVLEWLPAEAYQGLLDYGFERPSLASAHRFPPLPAPEDVWAPLSWRRVTRLPVHPIRGADESLVPRWQRL